MAIHKGSLWELSLSRVQTEAQVRVETRHVDVIESRVIELRKVGGSWRVTLKSGAVRAVCRSLHTGVRHSG